MKEETQMSDAIIGLITFAFAATASPGGATSLVTASGAQFGYLRSLPLVFGIAGTLAVLVAVSCTGLSGFILAFPILEVTMKVLGSAYLFLAGNYDPQICITTKRESYT